MTIEFYGLPGAGKTTTARLFAQKGEKYVYLHTSPRSEIIKLVPLFVLQNPKKALFWFSELFRGSVGFHFRALFRYKLHLLLITLAQYQKAKGDEDKIYLLDEGLFQRILAIYETKKTRYDIERCARYIPKIDKIVITENEPTEFYRFKVSPHRHESPRLRLGEAYFQNWMAVVRHNDKIIKEVIKAVYKNEAITYNPEDR